VAFAVTTGATNKEIAQQLGMTERTVKMHLGSIFQKLGVRDRVHLVLLLAKPTFEPVTRY
jgi:two-component system, NarL family, nitrate/nitrite response regulator NarL